MTYQASPSKNSYITREGECVQEKAALSIGDAWYTSRDLHRPDTPAGRRPAIRALLRQGLKVRDVAMALRIDFAEVLEAARRVDEYW